MHPPVRLERWPDADERTLIVLITRDLAPQAVTRPVRRIPRPQRTRRTRPSGAR
jgi:hypothetical protein